MAKKATPPTAKPSSLVDTRVIYCGDNLEQLKKLADACVDLIYIDPPFNSNRNYEVFWGETKEKRSFDDRHASTQAYIEFMRPRCVELARVLKKTGSFYYHCDWHASHHVRVMLDQIFGENNFQSEIIWKRTTAKSLAFKGYPNNHDTIFYYSGGKDFIWNRPFLEYDLDNLDEKTAAKYCHTDPDGRKYTLGDLTNPNPDRPNLTYEFLGHKKVWRWTKDRMEEAYAAGIVVQPSEGAVPRVKRYLDEQEGRSLDDVWMDIPPINSQAQERLGYVPDDLCLAIPERLTKVREVKLELKYVKFLDQTESLPVAEKEINDWTNRLVELQDDAMVREEEWLVKAIEELEVNQNFRYALLDAFIVAESIVARVLQKMKLAKGVSKKKLEDYETEIGVGYMLNVELPSMLEHLNEREREIIGKVDGVRKIRNAVIHKGADVSQREAADAINYVGLLITMLRARKAI
jgi:hypothetical protein